jgi:hypothetical protein
MTFPIVTKIIDPLYTHKSLSSAALKNTTLKLRMIIVFLVSVMSISFCLRQDYEPSSSTKNFQHDTKVTFGFLLFKG